MPRGRKPKTIFDTAYKTSIPVTTVQDRIKAAEKALLAGVTERVLVSDDDLEKIVSIIGDQGFTKAYILKRAVHLGLQVMSINPHSDVPEPEGRAEVAINKAFEDIERITPLRTLGKPMLMMRLFCCGAVGDGEMAQLKARCRKNQNLFPPHNSEHLH